MSLHRADANTKTMANTNTTNQTIKNRADANTKTMTNTNTTNQIYLIKHPKKYPSEIPTLLLVE